MDIHGRAVSGMYVGSGRIKLVQAGPGRVTYGSVYIHVPSVFFHVLSVCVLVHGFSQTQGSVYIRVYQCFRLVLIAYFKLMCCLASSFPEPDIVHSGPGAASLPPSTGVPARMFES